MGIVGRNVRGSLPLLCGFGGSDEGLIVKRLEFYRGKIVGSARAATPDRCLINDESYLVRVEFTVVAA